MQGEKGEKGTGKGPEEKQTGRKLWGQPRVTENFGEINKVMIPSDKRKKLFQTKREQHLVKSISSTKRIFLEFKQRQYINITNQSVFEVSLT